MGKNQKVIVIGGGAAGFFSALSVKSHFPNADVMIIEKSAKVLSKVKVSGGGRCNVTHACFDNVQLSKFSACIFGFEFHVCECTSSPFLGLNGTA